MNWSKQLSEMCFRTEQRVANYKKLVQEAYKNGDQELVSIFRGFKKEEEKFLQKLVYEKTCLNLGVWEWCLDGGNINSFKP